MSKELLPWEAEEIDLSSLDKETPVWLDNNQYPSDGNDEEDFLSGVTCNPDAPEECESCQ